MRFPGSPFSYPTKDELADYLETYARAFELPVRTAVKVEKLTKAGARFEVSCRERTLYAENVVLATGAFAQPRVPSFARDLHQNIVQLHSTEYRKPSQVRHGGVLVVGAGNSGAEIAMELARDHRTWLSGRDTGQEPTRAGSIPDHLMTPILWFMATQVLKVNNPVGRKARDYFLNPPRGIPLGRIRRALATRYGAPIHTRGVVESCAGLYLMGLPFLYSLSSALVGGVGRDAKYIVEHIAALYQRNGTRR